MKLSLRAAHRNWANGALSTQ